MILENLPKVAAHEKRRKISKEFLQSLHRIAPPNQTVLGRNFRHRVEGRDIMLPIKRTHQKQKFTGEQSRERKAALGHKLEFNRTQEVNAVWKEYEAKRAEMKVRHENENKEEKKDFTRLRLEAEKARQNYRDQYGIEVEHDPAWAARQKEADMILLGMAEKAEQKPERVPEIETSFTVETTEIKPTDYDLER